jgi:hypothetical protein
MNPTRIHAARAAVAVAIIGVILMVGTNNASAHIAILLDVRTPHPGAVLGPHGHATVVAQPTLAGVTHVIFRAAIDGNPIDPRTGRKTPHARPLAIAVSTTRRIPLCYLRAGSHRLTITYRLDTDEPPVTTAVDFSIKSTGSSSLAAQGAQR